MFGGLVKSKADQQRDFLALLNDDRLSQRQKAALCFDNGLCEVCGVKTHYVGPLLGKRFPYTNERVLNGICRTCHPEKCADAKAAGPAAPWGKMQKLVPPPEVLMAKTSSAFNSLQSSVSEGISTINESVNSEKAKAFRNETTKALDSMSSSVALGINSLNDNIKRNTEKMDMSGTTRAFSNFQSSVSEGINSINTKSSQKKEKAALSSLKTSFGSDSQDETIRSSMAELTLAENSEEILPDDLKGKEVTTSFGKGIVVDYRQEDEMFVIHLSRNLPQKGETKQKSSTTKLFCKRESFEVERQNQNRQKRTMELNAAYESMEKMRRLNLEVACQERGVMGPIDFTKCTTCLLNPNQEQSDDQPQNFPRIRKAINEHKKKKPAPPCLFCANPTCSDKHACPAFKKEGITACLECVKLFEHEYMVACINQAHGLSAEKAIEEQSAGESATEERPLEHMMDLYDRVLLLLQYTSQFIEPIASALEDNTKRGNNVNMGASSVGLVSGILGVGAAAAIFTPAGPPLLIASLCLGGGATAAQTGTEVANYFSEPNKWADKIIALTGMIHSLLKVKESLREILTARLLEEQGNPEIDRLKSSLADLRKKQRTAAVKAGATVASGAVLGGVAIAEVAAGAAAVESAALVSSVEVGALAGRNANMMSKSGTAIARGARFARAAGGILSAATILLEARTMQKTVEQIKAGHPCDKAKALRTILKEIPTLPTTEQLDEECRIYVGAMSNRINLNSLEDAINLIESKAIQEWQLTKDRIQEAGGDLAPEGASIVDGEIDDDDQSAWASVTGALTASLQGNSIAPTDADSVATPPVPRTISTSTIPLATSQSNLSPAAASLPARMTQSMSALPTTPLDNLPQQSALLDRIKKFKQEESFGSNGSTAGAPAQAP